MGRLLLSIFILLAGITLGGLLADKFRPLPEGKVIANQSAIDSLNAFIAFTDSIKNLPMEPVITKTDTVYIDVVKYVESSTLEPEPDLIDSTVTHYRDSLIRDNEINVWVDIKVKGYVEDLELNWEYKPVIRTIETTVEKPVYTPVITTIYKDKIKYPTGHYLSTVAGGNQNLFTFGVDYDLVKENRIYGFQYRRQGDQNIYGLKIGINLTTLFRNNR